PSRLTGLSPGARVRADPERDRDERRRDLSGKHLSRGSERSKVEEPGPGESQGERQEEEDEREERSERPVREESVHAGRGERDEKRAPRRERQRRKKNLLRGQTRFSGLRRRRAPRAAARNDPFARGREAIRRRHHARYRRPGGPGVDIAPGDLKRLGPGPLLTLEVVDLGPRDR